MGVKQYGPSPGQKPTPFTEYHQSKDEQIGRAHV